jgi:hypothetical protein
MALELTKMETQHDCHRTATISAITQEVVMVVSQKVGPAADHFFVAAWPINFVRT